MIQKFCDIDEEERDNSEPVKTSDQFKITYPKVSLEDETSSRFGGVVIKGFKKEDNIKYVHLELKSTGLPDEFRQDDLHITQRGNSLTL